jgi:hypothetical protein
MTVLRFALLAASIFWSACASPVAPGLQAGLIHVNGVILYFNLEGGFWGVRGNDGVTYKPMNGLGSQFLRDNLSVFMVARIRNDLGGIHMVGPIVEVVSIHLREPGISTGFPVSNSSR